MARHGRLCRARGLPLTPPDPFPQHTILAARTALIALDHPEGPDFCRAVFEAEFADGQSVSDRAVLAGCLHKAGLPRNLLDQAETGPVKQRMRDQVDTAVGLNIFGAPSFIAGTEKIEAITAMAVSPNKKYVAVAERAAEGEKALVTIFDLHTQ